MYVLTSRLFYAAGMLMNFISVKTQDKSLGRATGSSAPFVVHGDAADPSAENQRAVSRWSTSEMNVPEGGEEVECPSCQVPNPRGRSVSDPLAAQLADPPTSKVFYSPALRAVTPPALPTSGSNLLSKWSRVETDTPGLVSLSVGDDVPAITRFLRESLTLFEPGLGSRQQLVEAHAKFVNNVAEVLSASQLFTFYLHHCSFYTFFFFYSFSTWPAKASALPTPYLSTSS